LFFRARRRSFLCVLVLLSCASLSCLCFFLLLPRRPTSCTLFPYTTLFRSVWTMVQRVYFAFEDTRFLFFVQIPMALLQILGSLGSFLLLDVHYWVVGAGVATTASNTIGALVGYLALRRILPTLDGARVLRTHLRVLLATVPSVAAGWGLLHLWGVQTCFVGALARVVLLGALMALIYYILLRRLHVAELDQLTSRLAV